MELKINLSDRADIEAGHSLLTFLLDEQPVLIPPSLYKEFKAASASHAGPTAIDLGRPLTAAEAPAALFGAASRDAPPAPPVAEVPAAVVPQPAGPLGAAPLDVDKNGYPWDERIHSSGKTKLANGTWRYKGGIPPERIATVEAELRGESAAPAAQTEPAASAALDAAAVFAAAAQAVAPPPPPAVPVGPQTFEQLMLKLSAAAAANAMPLSAVAEACTARNLPSVVALQTSPQNVPLVWGDLVAKYPALAAV